jgi:hypothetical protein
MPPSAPAISNTRVPIPPQLNSRFGAFTGTASQVRSAYIGRPQAIIPPPEQEVTINASFYLLMEGECEDITPIRGNIPTSLYHMLLYSNHMLL